MISLRKSVIRAEKWLDKMIHEVELIYYEIWAYGDLLKGMLMVNLDRDVVSKILFDDSMGVVGLNLQLGINSGNFAKKSGFWNAIPNIDKC